ncbi:MAG: CoA-binding protein [Balneolaceae bacterium]
MINIKSQTKEILSESKTIAMIGCSPDNHRTSNYAAKFLQERGYKVIPVNPVADEILGEKCYPKLTEIPESIQIDIVNVFRNSKYSAEAVQDVAEWKAKTGQNPVVWTQLDVSSPEAEKIAEENNLDYVKNKCIMVEWERSFKQ